MLDFETAEGDLDATRSQAAAVAAFGFATRLTALLLPVAAVVSLYLLSLHGARMSTWAPLVVAAAGPLALTLVLSLPWTWWGALQSFWRGSETARRRFGLGGGNVYIYYGWRYGTGRRERPWGALTREEKVLRNPGRAGVR